MPDALRVKEAHRSSPPDCADTNPRQVIDAIHETANFARRERRCYTCGEHRDGHDRNNHPDDRKGAAGHRLGAAMTSARLSHRLGRPPDTGAKSPGCASTKVFVVPAFEQPDQCTHEERDPDEHTCSLEEAQGYHGAVNLTPKRDVPYGN